MSVLQLIELLNQHAVAIFFFMMLMPIFAFLMTMLAGIGANQPPFSYLFSSVIYLVTVPGVLSITLWIFSAIYGDENLLQLPFSLYYMPLISCSLTLFLIGRSANIKALPWFGELYELMILIGIVFAFILLMMQLQILPFKYLWQLLLTFLFIFILIKLTWERFRTMMM